MAAAAAGLRDRPPRAPPPRSSLGTLRGARGGPRGARGPPGPARPRPIRSSWLSGGARGARLRGPEPERGPAALRALPGRLLTRAVNSHLSAALSAGCQLSALRGSSRQPSLIENLCGGLGRDSGRSYRYELEVPLLGRPGSELSGPSVAVWGGVQLGGVSSILMRIEARALRGGAGQVSDRKCLVYTDSIRAGPSDLEFNLR